MGLGSTLRRQACGTEAGHLEKKGLGAGAAMEAGKGPKPTSMVALRREEGG